MARKTAADPGTEEKTRKGKKRKQTSEGSGTSAGSPPLLSVRSHPRAASAVRRAKGLGGLLGFAVTALVSLQASVPPDQAALRAVGFGVIGYLLAWACSVSVWRQLMLAEMHLAHEQVKARQAAEGPGLIPEAAGHSEARLPRPGERTPTGTA